MHGHMLHIQTECVEPIQEKLKGKKVMMYCGLPPDALKRDGERTAEISEDFYAMGNGTCGCMSRFLSGLLQ